MGTGLDDIPREAVLQGEGRWEAFPSGSRLPSRRKEGDREPDPVPWKCSAAVLREGPVFLFFFNPGESPLTAQSCRHRGTGS